MNNDPQPARLSHHAVLIYVIKWLCLTIIVGILAGTASALFLTLLDQATNFRESNLWIVGFLPLGGLMIGLAYHHWGNNVVKGTNQLLEEFHNPKQVIPIKMAPMVLFGTLITHLFGGSAGRTSRRPFRCAASPSRTPHVASGSCHDSFQTRASGIRARLHGALRRNRPVQWLHHTDSPEERRNFDTSLG